MKYLGSDGLQYIIEESPDSIPPKVHIGFPNGHDILSKEDDEINAENTETIPKEKLVVTGFRKISSKNLILKYEE